MTLKEHLQFLAMLIPTLLLIVAATVSLAFPGGRVAAAEAGAVDPFDAERVVVVQTEIGPVPAAEAR